MFSRLFLKPRRFFKPVILTLFSGFCVQKFIYFNQNPKIPAISFGSKINKELQQILENIVNVLGLHQTCNESNETSSVLIKNSLNQERKFDLENYEDLIKIEHFLNPPKLITKASLFELLEKIPPNEQIVLGYFKSNTVQAFNEIKYDFISTNSHFYLIDEVNAESLNMDLDDIFLIKPATNLNECPEKGTLEINSRKFLHEKTKIFEAKTKLLDFCLDHVNYIMTENEMINFLRLSEQKNISKLLIYHPIEKNDPELEAKRLKKFLDVSAMRDDIRVVFTKKESLLSNYFKIIPEKYIDTVRLIDFNEKITSIFENNTVIENNSNNDEIEPLNLTNYHHKLIPKTYNLSKHQLKKVGRYKYQGKITRNKLKNFIQNISEKTQPQYYECNNNYHQKYSFHLLGKNFKENVLESHQDWLIFFYKPGCTSCKVLSLGYEKFAETMIEIQEYLDKLKTNEISYARHESNIINKYKILNMEKFKNLKIARYNIFNECPEFANPSRTPLLLFFRSNKNKPPIVLDLMKERVNLNNQENIVETLIRIIDNRL